jgi:hypothetical protein
MALDISIRVENVKELQNKIKNTKISAKKHVSYMGAMFAKRLIGRAPWDQLSDMQKKMQKRKMDKPLQWFSSMIRYTEDKVGFISNRGNPNSFFERILKFSEEGRTVTVTPKMRRYLGYRGVPLKKDTTVLNITKRPILAPTRTYLDRYGSSIYTKKFVERMNK